MRAAICRCLSPLLLVVAEASAHAQRTPRQRRPYPTLAWAAAQLVPSPELVVVGGEAFLGLRWQVTPLLLAFGLRRGVDPVRSLVVDPIARYGGSAELFVSPEFVALPGEAARQWGLRVGFRFHVPATSGGEALAFFFGASRLLLRGEHSTGFEAGASTLFGLLGAQVTWHPRMLGGEAWFFTLRVRYL